MGSNARRYDTYRSGGGNVNTQRKVTIAVILIVPIFLGFVLALVGQNRQLRVPIHPTGPRIGLVKIADVIYSSDDHVRRLREFFDDPTVRGVIVRVNSPGGAVAPSQEIYAEIKRYRDGGKPLVVSMGNVAASGGYYIASPAHKIFANPGTLTGSIGVILQFPKFQGLMDKLGIEMETIKSGKFKDVANPHRRITAQERALLQGLLDDTHEQFLGDVAVVRPVDIDSLRTIADGRILNGRQAREVGLIDTLGTFQEALAYLRDHLGLPRDVKVVEKRRREPFVYDLIREHFTGLLPFTKAGPRPAGCYFLLQSF
ncbi:MAG: signal peptide peptidase SppA [Chitinivibrionales bacterium]|nr:signal peptide peptidase SppA [Chitinivibrionales bacterium]MBD3356116.1 signal peptide peptidase SppA [Chitinivibrionales bacterium]